MAWTALIGPLAGLIGAGATGYAAYQNSKDSQQIADQSDPARVAQLNAQYNNINRYTPFGSVEYHQHKGNPNDPSDDRWSMTQSYSPQMQQLADAMLGIAGGTPATFTSSMPSGLRDRMSDVYGSDVPESSYGGTQYGFGQDRRNGPVMEGFNWQNYDEQGNQVADDPYVPWTGSSGEFGGDPTTDQLLDITPGQTTNRQILDQMYNNGYISDYDYYALNDYWQKKGAGKGNRFGWSEATSEDDLADWMPDNLHHRLLNSWDNVRGALFAYNPSDNTEPSPAQIDPNAMNALAQALQGVTT